MSDRICTTPDCLGRVEYVSKGICRRCNDRERGKKRRKGGTLPSTPNIARFEARLEPGPNGCWNWSGGTMGSGGRYGSFVPAGRVSFYAHRWSYEYHRAEIPEGLEIDHLCRNTLCVNPWHLEPVTRQVNATRMGEAITECKHGHPYTDENTYVRQDTGARQCRTCRRAALLASRARRQLIAQEPT